VISGFLRVVDENCALLGYDAAISGNFLPVLRDSLTVPSSGLKNKIFTTENGTEKFFRNVCKKLPLLAA